MTEALASIRGVALYSLYTNSVSKERKEFLSLVNKEPYLLSEMSPGLRELREELKDLRGDGIGFDIWM
ncbi:hypothetical protein GUJ93_ZPchr0003g16507 [Zizania palustris]|uniref:Uncharacterized protein n=1 Tax=Zizania palustris TaxID=103762 RepID=A0A8J5RKN3_ZIZPA|nr:hypothetical protein GUJ93_ZPchr0003g16507 [Zizania palustris]